ncbi:MAG TPA: 50S ribosomal protein L19 [Polyangiales bacterium]|jgi:large subunit ribosomal protein L19|nr:50S ribosomal protein L19 [Polyangiales bacterium]
MGRYFPEIEAIEAKQIRQLPPFRVGDTVKVHYRITEGEKERIQVFQGLVIRLSRGGLGRTFAVRKVSAGVGVERVFPQSSPNIDKLEVVSSGRVRRSKLYYLRDLAGKKARLREVRDDSNDAPEAAAAKE